MDVVYELAGRSAGVAQEIVAVGLGSRDHGAGNPAETSGYLSEKLGGAFVQLSKVLFGDDQGVALTNRADIQKCQSDIIFVDFCSGYFGGYDLTEDAIIRTH